MFGGKQVVVCGYGEVEWIFFRFIHDIRHMKYIVFL